MAKRQIHETQKGANPSPTNNSKNSTSKDNAEDIARSAFSGAQYLMGLQLFVKIVTFVMNTVIVKLAGLETYGVASVDFELLLSTILFLSREGTRNALLRIDTLFSAAVVRDPDVGQEKSANINRLRNTPSARDQMIINVSLLPVAVGTIISMTAYALYIGNIKDGTEYSSHGMPYYRVSLALYILSALIELCVEPLFVLSRSRIMFKIQAQCEGISVAARCAVVALVLLVGAYISDPNIGNPFTLLAFAAGQVSYSIVMVGSFVWNMSGKLEFPVSSCYIPRKIACNDQRIFISWPVLKVAAVFVSQSLLKHLLTQGDSIIMVMFASDKERGVFALVTNYGSLPARIIFFPLEEASRTFFSSIPSKDATVRIQPGADRRVERLCGVARDVLITLGKFQLILGLILSVFGTSYSTTALILVGQNEGAVAQAMGVYCLYLPLMGLNGFLEAFVHSVATNSQLIYLNLVMVVFTVVYTMTAAFLLSTLKLGATGVIIANMINMGMRVVWSSRFISRWFAQQKVSGPRFSDMVPSSSVLLSCLISAAAIVFARGVIGQGTVLSHLGLVVVGGVFGVITLAAIWKFERSFIVSIQALRSGKTLKVE